jgi:hypothetical protein
VASHVRRPNERRQAARRKGGVVTRPVGAGGGGGEAEAAQPKPADVAAWVQLGPCGWRAASDQLVAGDARVCGQRPAAGPSAREQARLGRRAELEREALGQYKIAVGPTKLGKPCQQQDPRLCIRARTIV